MLPGTWKSYRLEKQLEIYQKYKNKKLSDIEIVKVNQQIAQIPESIPKEWMDKKFKEKFSKETKDFNYASSKWDDEKNVS